MMNYSDKAYHRIKREGLADRNWLRLERMCEGWVAPETLPTADERSGEVGSGSEIEILLDSHVEDFRPRGKPRGWRRLPPKRFGPLGVLREKRNRQGTA